jgi:hypothetical protein
MIPENVGTESRLLYVVLKDSTEEEDDDEHINMDAGSVSFCAAFLTSPVLDEDTTSATRPPSSRVVARKEERNCGDNNFMFCQ